MIWSRFFPVPEQPWWRSTQSLPPNKGEIGEAARKLLDDPVLHEALARVERKLIESWKNSAAGDGPSREEAYRMFWAVGALKVELRIMIANASMSARERQ